MNKKGLSLLLATAMMTNIFALSIPAKAMEDTGVEITKINYAETITKPDVITNIRASGDDESIKLSWDAPNNGGSPILNYIISIAISEGNDVIDPLLPEVNYQISGENNTDFLITGLTNNAEYSIALISENAFAASDESERVLVKPVKALKADIVFGKVEGPNTDADSNGTMILKNSLGQEIKDNKVKVGEYVIVEAIPAKGMKFVKFTKSAKSAPILFSLGDVAVGTEIFTNPFVYKVEEGSTFDVTFAENVLIDNRTESSIVSLNATQAEGRRLVQPDNTPNFSGKVSEYSLYLMSQDSKTISFRPIIISNVADATLTMTNGANNIYTFTADTTATNKSTYATHNYTINNSETLTFNITEKGKSPSVYTIKINVSDSYENDAAFFGEVKAFAGSDEVEISLKAKNTELNSASMTIGIKDLVKLPGFTNRVGILFDDAEKELRNDPSNYFSLNSLFRVDSMRSDGTFLNISISSRSGKSIKIGNDGLILVGVKVKQVGFSGTLEELSNLFEVKNHTVGTSSFSSGAINDRYYGGVINYATPADPLEQPIYISPALKETLKWSIDNQAALDNGRIEYKIFDISETFPRLITTYSQKLTEHRKKPANTELTYDLFSGEYSVQVIAKGYLTLNTQFLDERNINKGSIKLDGRTTIDGIKISPIILLEGDLNNDGIIDATDRSLLISALGQTTNSQGNYGDIYANYNSDTMIDGLDLGRLIANYGLTSKSYKR